MRLFSKCDTKLFWYKLKFITPVIVYAVAGFLFFIPSNTFAALEQLQYFDKIFHFVVFTILTLSVPSLGSGLLKMTYFMLLILLGIGVETIQYYTPNRGASLQDLLANILGVLFGFFIKLFRPTHKDI